MKEGRRLGGDLDFEEKTSKRGLRHHPIEVPLLLRKGEGDCQVASRKKGRRRATTIAVKAYLRRRPDFIKSLISTTPAYQGIV